jgi:nitrate/TMAO reductase-like tetraheme cytochrome c subunit
MRRLFEIPGATRHPVSLLGAAVTSVAALVFLVLFALDVLGAIDNPYAGLLLYVALPALFVLGLLLIPLGASLEARRRRRHPDAPPPEWPVLDLRVPARRRLLLAILGLTAVNLVVISLAAFGALHAMETTAFCGRVCHVTMEPEYVAHQRSAHARVACVHCHVGAGAAALAESKVAGSRRLWHEITGRISRPIEAPVRNMGSADRICEACHRAETRHGDRLRVIREYGDDEQNQETVTTLTMHVGGGSRAAGAGSGIHWHMNLANRIEYVSTDAKREVIPLVRLTSADGVVREFVLEGATPEQIAGGTTRRMDCLDCHNRPAHTMGATPERAVNEAMAAGLIPRDLPFAHREAVAAVRADYPDRAAALQAIATRLREHYRAYPAAAAAQVDRAVAGAQELWLSNVFPAMKVTWGTYPNHLGHVDSNGCFRCHDDNHKTKDGAVIRQDCELCHSQS